MTNLSHFLVAGLVSFKLTYNTPFAVTVAIGGVLPDYLEFAVLPRRKPGLLNDPLRDYVFRKIHRKLTHWFLPYIVLAILCVAMTPEIFNYLKLDSPKDYRTAFTFMLSGCKPAGSFIGLGISLGAFLHILLDSLSGKVPGLSPFSRKLGVNWIKTGSIQEFLFLVIVGAFAFFL